MNFLKAYSLSTLRSLCGALVPETPDLAEQKGEEHRPGAESIRLEEQVYEAFNNLSEVDLGPLNTFFSSSKNLPLAPAVAALLDATALEYMANRPLEEPPDVDFSGGPFSWLSEADRRALIDYLSQESFASSLNNLLDGVSPYSGFLKFLTRGIASVPLITYYSEWDGYDQEDGKWIPDPEKFTGSVQSWEQTGFPGLKEGYSVHRGYEVEEFEENPYR